MVERVEDAAQPPAQVAGLGELLVHPREVGGDRGPQVVVERGLDRLEREPEAAQRDDLVEPLDVRRAVAAVAGAGALGRAQQPDLVPVVQRPDREAGGRRELADCGWHPALHARTSRYVRFKGSWRVGARHVGSH